MKHRLPAWLDELEDRAPGSKNAQRREPGLTQTARGVSCQYGYLYEGGFVPFNEDPMASATAFAIEILDKHNAAEVEDLVRAVKAPVLELRIALVQVLIPTGL